MWEALLRAIVAQGGDRNIGYVFIWRDEHGSVLSRILLYDDYRKTLYGIPARCPYCPPVPLQGPFNANVHVGRRDGKKYRTLMCDICGMRGKVRKPDWLHPCGNTRWFWADFPLLNPSWPTLSDLEVTRQPTMPQNKQIDS